MISKKQIPKLSKKKKTKKNNNLQKTLKIISYNISWESMTGADNNWTLCSNNKNLNHPKHNSICVGNIADVFNDNKSLDFVTLQEAVNFEKLIEQSSQLKNMKYEIYKSGLEIIVTFWDPKYKYLYSITGEFESGRPWMGIIFKNGICLVNVHFGHYNNKKEYRHIEKMLFILKEEIRKKEDSNKIKINVNRFIISGDFNYNIKEFGNSNKNIIINGTKFYYHPKHILTCCIKRRTHYDHVIDSMARPIEIKIPDVKYMASDHKPILVELIA